MDYENITNKERAIIWIDSIINTCERITPANYMHHKNHIKAGVEEIMGMAEFKEIEHIQRSCRIIRNQCDFMTSGNMSHNIACTKSKARYIKSLLEAYGKQN